MKQKETIIVSVGGSLIFPNEIDTEFLKNFRELILSEIKKNKRFVIICGGGKICRKYQEAANSVSQLTKEDTDWLGIHVTRLNANLMRTLFLDITREEVIDNPNEKKEFDKLLIACGWKPGCSTDNDAVLMAKTLGIKKIANLTNIDYIYDKNPKEFKDAKPIKNISWKEFRKILPAEWKPGLNSPFDPVAAKEAEKLKIEIVSINGNNLKNFENYLNNKDFIGSSVK